MHISCRGEQSVSSSSHKQKNRCVLACQTCSNRVHGVWMQTCEGSKLTSSVCSVAGLCESESI